MSSIGDKRDSRTRKHVEANRGDACVCSSLQLRRDRLGLEVASADSSPREVFARGTPVRCLFRHEGWVTASTGPCDEFTPPARITIGARFKANGKERIIEAITATQSDTDWSYGDFKMHKGEWACAAAETEADMSEGHHDALWLSIMPCQPASARE
jgi:hypothetical protein